MRIPYGQADFQIGLILMQDDILKKSENVYLKETFRNMLNNLNVNKALVVLEDGNVNAELSARNIANVKTARTNTINVFDILKYNTVIASKAAVANIEEVYA